MQEELNIEVKPLRLLFVRDYIAKNHYMTLDLPCFHLAELMFECQVSDFSPLEPGSEPDNPAQRIKWLNIDTLADSDFYLKTIIPYLKKLKDIKETIILGDIN